MSAPSAQKKQGNKACLQRVRAHAPNQSTQTQTRTQREHDLLDAANQIGKPLPNVLQTCCHGTHAVGIMKAFLVSSLWFPCVLAISLLQNKTTGHPNPYSQRPNPQLLTLDPSNVQSPVSSWPLSLSPDRLKP